MLSGVEDRAEQRTAFCVAIVRGRVGTGGTRESRRRSILVSDLLSMTSPKMKNFRNAHRIRITESCPNY